MTLMIVSLEGKCQIIVLMLVRNTHMTVCWQNTAGQAL